MRGKAVDVNPENWFEVVTNKINRVQKFEYSIYKDILPTKKIDDNKLCICGDILKGKANPKDCKVFGKACTPSNPLGSCMVSSEGACAAYYKYGDITI